MNILFLSLFDFNSLDERNIYTDLIRSFIENGHYVYAVSPIEKRKKQRTHQIENGNLTILKSRIGNIQKTNLIKKGISMITLESKLKQSIKEFTVNRKFDLILYTTPPITFYKAIKYLKERDNAKTYLLLKDIFPQNSLYLGVLSEKGLKSFIFKYFKKKEKKLYAISDYIGCLSPANIKFLFKYNPELSSKPIEVCPNSIEQIELQPVNKKSLKDKFHIPEICTTFIYGGNLGRPQDVDFIIRCLMKNINLDNRYFIICGTGTDYYKLEEFFKKVNPNNMRLINGLPKKEYDELVSASDVGLIFLDHRFTIPNFPSRLLSYMENSLPTLACTDLNTDIGKIIETEKFGWWCESNNEQIFFEMVNHICKNKEYIGEFGNYARLYLENNYTSKQTYQIIMKHFVLNE